MIPIHWTKRPEGFQAIDAVAPIGALAAVTALAYPHVPWLRGMFPSCHFLAFTGYPCGTCGFTRAFVRAARFDWAGAFVVSPLGTVVFYGWVLAAVWIALSWLHPGVKLPRLDAKAMPLVARFGILAVFLGNWAYLLIYRWVFGAPPA